MTLDKGQDPQDSHLEGKAPGEGDGTSPAQEPETFTKAQFDAAVQKARIDTGREAKARADEALNKSLKEKDDAIGDLQRRIDEIDNEKYRDDPDGLSHLQEKRKLNQEKSELKKQRQEIEDEKAANADKLKRADELEVEITVWKAAQAHTIDADALKAKCQKFNLTTEDQIEEMAQTLAGTGSSTDPDAKKTLKADSNRSSGGGNLDGLSSKQLLNKAYSKKK